MKFYTNIQLIGNQFLIRGYENGKHITHREEWKPTLFVPSKRKTKYKTLEGESVEPMQNLKKLYQEKIDGRNKGNQSPVIV